MAKRKREAMSENRNFAFVVDETGQPKLENEFGQDFYYATSINKRTHKPQKFKVYVLDSKPATESDFAPLISKDMSNYEYVGASSGGSNYIGEFGGRYNFCYVTRDTLGANTPTLNNVQTQMVLFKQDTRKGKKPIINHAKNIIEYFAGGVMKLIAGDAIASTFLATRPLQEHEDELNSETRQNSDVYVGSIMFNNAQDLYKDINRLNGINPIGSTRPYSAGVLYKNWFRTGIVDPLTNECRYEGIEEIFAATLVTGDYDVHSGNIMVVAERDHNNPFDNMAFQLENGNPKRNSNGKIGILKKIDHAGAMRNWGDVVRMNLFRFWYGPSKDLPGFVHTQPTNHFREYPRAVIITPAFAKVLEEKAQLATKISTQLNAMWDEIENFYDLQGIIKVAQRMDLDLTTLFKDNPEDLNNIINGLLARPRSIDIRVPKELISADDPDAARKTAEYRDNLTTITKEHNEKHYMLKAKLMNFMRHETERKLNSHLKSLKNLATDVKLSLCFKQTNKWDNSFEVDPNSPYKVKDILNENPDYIINDKYHFRGPNQSGWGAWFASLGTRTLHLHNLAINESTKAALEIVQNAMIKRNPNANINTSNYDLSFYHKAKPNTLAPIPANVYQMVISKKELKESYFSYFTKQEKTKPTLSTSTPAENKQFMLKPDEYSLNFVDSKKPGEKGYYIESMSAKNEYQITLHRLPPELNKRYYFSEAVNPLVQRPLSAALLTQLFLKNSLGEVKDDIVIEDTITRHLRSIMAKITYDHTNKTVSYAKLSDDKKATLFALLGVDSDTAATAKILNNLTHAYEAANFQQIPNAPANIPSDAYLEWAFTTCQAMILRNGPKTKIELLPDITPVPERPYNVKDPIFIQACMIVCKKNNWKMENLTNVPKYTADELNVIIDNVNIPAPAITPTSPTPPKA